MHLCLQLLLHAHNIVFEVLVSFELALHVLDVPLESDLSVVCLLKLLPELIEPRTQRSPFLLEVLHLRLERDDLVARCLLLLKQELLLLLLPSTLGNLDGLLNLGRR